MTIERKVLGTTPVSGEVLPEAVSFDGTSDYLSRSTDMTGNADGKTFTISAWVNTKNARVPLYYNSSSSANNIGIELSSGGNFSFINSVSSASRWNINSTSAVGVLNTWQHVLFSFDADSQANCKLYVDDVAVPLTFTTFSTGSNVVFTSASQVVGAISWALSVKTKGRLSNLFLDYTYRNLSIEANRRLFITADGKPADGQADLSPILYLPMTDADTAGSNLGTGGDFTVNGVLATADRGANQDNCSASYFDGVDDSLSKASITGLTDGKTLTISFNVNSFVALTRVFHASKQLGWTKVAVNTNTDSCVLTCKNASWASVLSVTSASSEFKAGRALSVQISFDLTDTGKRHFYVNGFDVSPAWGTYTNDSISFAEVTEFAVGSLYTSYTTGDIGEFYFDTTYTDLATDNPFWDSDTNRPNSVRKVIEDTGVTPLIAMPIDASNPTKNYGTGGDFTLNGGGLVGARGGSEFWARSAKFNNGGISDALIRTTALTGASDGKTMTLACAFKGDVSAGGQVFSLANGSAFLPYLNVTDNTNNRVDIQMRLSSSYVLDCKWNDAAAWSDAWQVVIFSVDMTSVSKRHFYVNGDTSNVTWTTYVDANLQLSLAKPTIGNRNNSGVYEEAEDGSVGFMYLSDDYIDFSQEANRNLFVNQLGYPRDLQPLIDEGTIPEPLIYLPFDDTTNLGKNLGTGGDFTVNGTVTAGADFSI